MSSMTVYKKKIVFWSKSIFNYVHY